MSVTLRDIARRAHVSVSTVSRALNDHSHVSQVTREAVHRVARELGYSLSNLRSASPRDRAVLVLTYTQDWEDAQDIRSIAVEGVIAYGVRATLEQHGIAARLQYAHMSVEEARGYAGDPRVAGVILATGTVDSAFLRELQALEVPFVVAGSHVRPLWANCVTADYAHGIELAVAHLVERGRRRIALVNGPPTTTSSAEKRKGFCLAQSTHELDDSTDLVLAGKAFTPEAGYQETVRLLAQAADVEGVVYGNDPMAIGGMRALKESGRRVPEDVSVAGYYDYELGRFSEPPLTSVHFDLELVGRIAARRLCMMLAEPDGQSWCITVPTSLVVRDST
jgi:LacI family transcriptional regulator